MAWVIVLLLILQSTSGAYLRLHLPHLRSPVLRLHGILGRLYPLVGEPQWSFSLSATGLAADVLILLARLFLRAGWTQILFGAMTYAGYCLGEEALQCYAHWTFGSSYLIYGTLLTVSRRFVAVSSHTQGPG